MILISRYDVLPYNECKGMCEGTGFVPVYMHYGDLRGEDCRRPDETNSELIYLWWEAEDKSPTEDGWHFVRCPLCSGDDR